jgi:hypothetical protein
MLELTGKRGDRLTDARYEHSQRGKMNWIPVTVFQPEPLVLVEKALFMPPAISLPALRKSCRDTTTRPRNGAGTISDWYVLSYNAR